MKYIVETGSMTMLKNKIDELKKQNEISSINSSFLDYERENNFNEALGNYLSDNLSGEKKLILLKNSSFLNEKKLNNHFLEALQTTINSDTNNIIIFQISKLKITNTYYGKHKDNFKLIKLNTPKGKETISFISNYFTNNNIGYSPEIVKQINYRVGDNFDLLVNELKKLNLINETLNYDFIEQNVFDIKGESIFSLIEAIFKKDFFKLDNSIEKLRIQGYSAIQILEYLINDLIILLQIKIHYQIPNAKYSRRRDILARQTGINSFRILKSQENAKLWTDEKLLDFLEKMINLEIQLMINNSENQLFILKTSLELFLSNLE